MLPISSNPSTRASLASYSSNARSPTDSSHAVDAAEGGSVMQINYGLVNIPVHGLHNTVTVNYHSTSEDANLLAETLRPLQSTAWQPNTAPLANLGIKALQKKYLEGLQKDNEIKDALAMYVAPECTLITDTRERFSLEGKVKDFLASEEKKVLLLLGEAGSGKSTFNRYLARSLWEAYDNKADKSGQTPIPLFISLSSLKEPNTNLISEYLKKEKFTEAQIADLKENYRFIFILDGYDEIKDRTRLFYVENELDQWQAKVIITSRPEYLGDRYERQFHPKGQAHLLQAYRLAPFSDLTIEEYVNKYKSIYTELENDVAEYGGILERPEVKELVRNPFLLKMALSELPALGQKYKKSGQRITRIALYDQFVESWFERSQDRLSGISLTDAERKAFDFLNKAFIRHGTKFSKDFAIAMYQAGIVHVTYSEQLSYDRSDAVEQDWRDKFLSDRDEQIKLLRFNAPLICRNDQYQFIHKSVQDYFVARALWEEFNAHEKIERSFWFNTLNIVNDPAVLQFLAERVRQEPKLEPHLLRVVDQSKGEEGVQFERGAANALTLLVKAGVQLISKDFNGIRVRGADLGYGVFDHTQFEEADLREVNGYGAWLRGVNLNGADLAGVYFGEKPALEMEWGVNACCYSPDGRWLAVAEEDTIHLYETEDLQKIHTYTGHNWFVTSVAFSNDGQWLASGSRDYTVKLWHVSAPREEAHTYTGHEGDVNTGGVTSVAFSLDGQWLASGSGDNTVKLWHVSAPREEAHTYTGHEDEVTSVAFSNDSQWLASGSMDNTVKLWHVSAPREEAHTYTGHKWVVRSVAFSNDGQWLASGSWDNSVKLWHVSVPREEAHTYRHESWVNSVAFSKDGQWLASGSADRKVTLWHVSAPREEARTYAGHEGSVKSVAFSIDSQWLASGSGNKVRLWHVSAPREEVHTHTGHGSWATSVAFSKDGQWLASGSDDNTVKLWHVSAPREEAHTYTGHKGGVNSVAFSNDGQWLASGSRDNTVKLWHVSAPREEAHTYTGHKKGVNAFYSGVNSVAFSNDRQWLASGSWDNTLKLWHVSGTREEAHTYTGHEGVVKSVAFSNDGQWLASGSEDNTVKLWHVSPPREEAHTYTGHRSWATCVAFSNDGQWLASGSDSNTVKLWHVSGTREEAHTYSRHEGAVESVAFSNDGQWLASGSANTVRLWSVRTGDCQAVLPSFADSIYKVTVVWRPEQEGAAILSTAGGYKTIRLWRVSYDADQISRITLDWTSQQDTLTAAGALIGNARNLSPQNAALLRQRGAGWAQILALKVGEMISACSYSPDGQWLAVGARKGRIKLYDAKSLELKFTFEGHSAEVNRVSFSANGKWLASCSDDCTVKLWRVEGGSEQEPKTFGGHGRAANAVSLSTDGKLLVSGDADGTVRVWSLDNGVEQKPKVFEEQDTCVMSISLSADGKWLAAGYDDGIVKLWSVSVENDIEQLQLFKTFKEHRRGVLGISFSPDGKRLASGSDDATVKLWRVEGGSEQAIKTFKEHSETVRGVSFSPDGKWLASGSYDCTVKLWSVEGSLERSSKTLEGHGNQVTSVSFSVDGKWLASGSDDKTVRLWDAQSGQLSHTLHGHNGLVPS